MFERKLGFGLMRLPQNDPEDYTKVDLEALGRMVDVFLERGFNYFDTAYMYHGGSSETSIRETLSKRYPRDRFLLADKMPILSVEKKEDQQKVFDEQLERCGVDYFDMYLVHNLGVDNYRKAQAFDTFGFVSDRKKEGRARQIGFSYHDTSDLLDIILGDHPEVDFVQLQINYKDWENESIQSRKCYEVARKHGKPIIVMEPAKGGSLANVPQEVETLFREHAPDMSATSWAIRYAASLDGVAMVLSGMSDLEQLLDNTSFMQAFKPLTAVEHGIVEKAARIIDETVAIPCTACQYCVDTCPQNIPIPKYFALYNDRKRSVTMPFYVQQAYYDNHSKLSGKASACVACGACERSCPQHLEVVRYMKDVAEMFEPE